MIDMWYWPTVFPPSSSLLWEADNVVATPIPPTSWDMHAHESRVINSQPQWSSMQ